jgi:pyridoxamine 5'-phosphate oxidase
MTSSLQDTEFYNDIDLSFTKAWDLIEPGASKRSSAAHTPVVGTVDGDGVPQLRVMVLREADRNMRRLRFHTDLRSTKIGEIALNSNASVLMYDAGERLQLRLGGKAILATDPEAVNIAWSGSTPFARRCYMSEMAPATPSEGPTSGLPQWIEGRQPDEAQLSDARENFALLLFEVHSIEWLFLANMGHRRARWDWQDENSSWTGRWLVP